jgi:MFS family permease
MLGLSFVGRLQIGMAGIAIVLACQERTGSFAVAGATSAAFALGTGLGAQTWSRHVDRHGRGVLAPLAAAHLGAVVALVLAIDAALPAVPLVALGLLAGAAFPPMSSVTRSLWPHLLADRRELVGAGLALESLVVELVFTSGPLVVVAVGALASPGLALVAGALLTVGGLVGFLARVPAAPRTDADERRGRGGALASRGLQTVVLAILPLGMCFGAMEVALPAFAEAEGRVGLGGVPLAVWSLGSAIGGLAYGAVAFRGALGVRLQRFLLVLPLGYVLLPVAPSLVALTLLAFLAGTAIAPTLTAAYELTGAVAPPGTETEAMSWPVTALVIGIAAGNAVAGQVAEALGARATLGFAVACCAAAALVALARRGTLAAPPGERAPA